MVQFWRATLGQFSRALKRVSLHQDNNLTDEARAHAERNWSVMLAGLKHFVEHNRPTIDTEPD